MLTALRVFAWPIRVVALLLAWPLAIAALGKMIGADWAWAVAFFAAAGVCFEIRRRLL